MKNIVFDIGGTAIKHSVCIDGILREVRETPTEASRGGRHVMDTVMSLIRKYGSCDAVGISTAGQVNPERGSIIYANSNLPSYTGMEIAREIQEAFHIPAAVENDVNCAALGEAVYGAGREYDSFLCLTYGTGVGGAIVENKRIYHGSGFSAGEFGGIVTHGAVNSASDDVFGGCYERYASASALVNRAAGLDPSLRNGRLIFGSLQRPEVREIVDGWIGEIITGLITIIHIFNPSCIILGGGIMSQDYILKEINRRLYPKIMPSFSHVAVLPASLGNTAGLLGANYLAENIE